MALGYILFFLQQDTFLFMSMYSTQVTEKSGVDSGKGKTINEVQEKESLHQQKEK